MTQAQIEIQLIAVVTAIACALPGVFLVLQRKAMLTDAISHTVLLGIVLGFFLVGDLSSPFLVIGAALVGVLTVSMVAVIERTRLVKVDAAIGLVFPILFSIAVILISVYAGNVHLDTDVVLVGEIAFVPFDRLIILGQDVGPRGLWVMSGSLILNLIFILLFYKELKLTSFDAGLAATLGFMPVLLHYALMSLVSVTVVAAFDIVGSILVVALMIAPAATAYLMVDDLKHMLIVSLGIGAFNAVSGYWLARVLDASIAGAMASMCGVVFIIVFLFAPKRGLVAAAHLRKTQRHEFAITMLTAHLLNHEHSSDADFENSVSHMGIHMRWKPEFATQIVEQATSQQLIEKRSNRLFLTDLGRNRANQEFMQ
ncbi:MAG TPA: metal ABC transporter permease [Anaerolineaceae bacterium]|nr:metal ABC transporter permease [Anaerolineaceae bacterium]